MLPHPPFVFGPDGGPRPLQQCFPRACGFWDRCPSQLSRPDFAQAATDQLQYLNQRMLKLVDRLLAREEPPVIILLSDHGSRQDPDNVDEMHRNFFAAFTPGHPGLFDDDATPISVFPRLLNAYLGDSVPEPEPRGTTSTCMCGPWHRSMSASAILEAC